MGQDTGHRADRAKQTLLGTSHTHSASPPLFLGDSLATHNASVCAGRGRVRGQETTYVRAIEREWGREVCYAHALF
jgi:hypothetical protein